MAAKEKSEAPKAPREVDQVRQIAFANGAKVSSNVSGAARVLITITQDGVDSGDAKFRAMLYAIEGAVRGHFDRGQSFQTMTQFVLKSNRVDVIVRCLK